LGAAREKYSLAMACPGEAGVYGVFRVLGKGFVGSKQKSSVHRELEMTPPLTMSNFIAAPK
ncbi:Ubiquitin conjugation factor E4, partial [Clarias magur]